MNVLIQNPTTFFPSFEAAAKIAAANNQFDNSWEYLPIALPDGKAKVMVVDEDDMVLGYL